MSSNNHKASQGRRWIAEMLQRNWDPVGADTSPDQFDAFVTEIERLISARATPRQLADYLVRVETERLGWRDTKPKMLIPLAKKLLRLNVSSGSDDSAA